MTRSEQPRRVESVVLRDPAVSHGRFRHLSRTDGKWIVYDPDLPLGKRTVNARTFDSPAKAEDYSRACALEDATRCPTAP